MPAVTAPEVPPELVGPDVCIEWRCFCGRQIRSTMEERHSCGEPMGATLRRVGPPRFGAAQTVRAAPAQICNFAERTVGRCCRPLRSYEATASPPPPPRPPRGAVEACCAVCPSGDLCSSAGSEAEGDMGAQGLCAAGFAGSAARRDTGDACAQAPGDVAGARRSCGRGGRGATGATEAVARGWLAERVARARVLVGPGEGPNAVAEVLWPIKLAAREEERQAASAARPLGARADAARSLKVCRASGDLSPAERPMMLAAACPGEAER